MEDRKKLMPEGIPEHLLSDTGFMSLDMAYEQAVAELGVQQSKRDQIIGFYLTIISFLVPFVISQGLPAWVTGLMFCCIYGIGVAFCFVILRYRVYKECYWIACRVILQLNHILESERSHGVIRTLYYHALKKNCDKVVITKENKKKGKGQPTRVPCYLRTMKRQIDSAETLLFETLAVVSSLAGGIGVYYFWQTKWWLGCGLIVILVCMLVRLNWEYIHRLASLYECVYQTDAAVREKKLDSAFNKAWMLHCSVDDILITEKAAAK